LTRFKNNFSSYADAIESDRNENYALIAYIFSIEDGKLRCHCWNDAEAICENREEDAKIFRLVYNSSHSSRALDVALIIIAGSDDKCRDPDFPKTVTPRPIISSPLAPTGLNFFTNWYNDYSITVGQKIGAT